MLTIILHNKLKRKIKNKNIYFFTTTTGYHSKKTTDLIFYDLLNRICKQINELCTFQQYFIYNNNYYIIYLVQDLNNVYSNYVLIL